MSSPRRQIYQTLGLIAPLGFAPIAIHFGLFDILAKIDQSASGQSVLNHVCESSKDKSVQAPRMIKSDYLIPTLADPSSPSTEDTLVAMAALSWVDRVDDGLFAPNEITRFLATNPPVVHGILLYTTEGLLASAFLMRQMTATEFKYPFTRLQTPMQYAHRMMGNERLAAMHTYSIMAAEGRMPSFNTFMEGRHSGDQTPYNILTSLGYDLDAVIGDARSQGLPVTMVDIGGGRGQLLLELKNKIPGLRPEDLILEEFNPDITEVPGVTLVQWDYAKEGSPQPIPGALVYHLSHILHNLPDLDAGQLLQKLSAAMAPYSRILIYERRLDAVLGANASMAVLFGGREIIEGEWHQLAEVAGLKVAFQAYPSGTGRGLIEMRKV
ncbi:S-adenosyl-L-methionine-dependent methyltransferase [Aspergillus californicus]